MKIFAGSHSESITNKICDMLLVTPGKLKIERFKDGEILPTIMETVRGEKVYIIQSTNTPASILELLLIIDAFKRSSAEEINCIIPYFGYGRQDRRDTSRSSVGSKLIIDLIEKAIHPRNGRIVTIDLHAMQIQGFANIPFEHVYGYTVFKHYIKKLSLDNLVLCSPDVGGIKRAKNFLKVRNDMGLVLIDKERVVPNEVSNFELIGDVTGKNVIIVDDIIDTGGTLFGACDYLLKEKGAKSVQAFITHALFSNDNVYEKLNNSLIDKLIITDSIYRDYSNLGPALTNKLEVVSIAPVIAEVIPRLTHHDSIDEINDVKSVLEYYSL